MPLPFGTTSANSITYASGIATYLAQSYLWDPAYALSQDPAVYEKLFRDPVVAGASDQLQRLIVGHDWSFEPAEDDQPGRLLAKVLEGLTKQQRGFQQALYNLSRAHLVGATWGLIVPERRVLKIGDGKPREWTVVSRVRDVDKRRLRLTQIPALGYPVGTATPPDPPAEGGDRGRDLEAWVRSLRERTDAALARAKAETDRVTTTGFDGQNLGLFRWEFHRGWDWRASGATWWTPIERTASLDRWLLYTPDDSERGLGYGYGMADDLYYYYWAKQSVLRWGLQGVERWGQGFLYAKTKALRENNWAKGTSQSAALQQTVNTLRTFRSENVAAVDADTELALLDMPATAAVEVREWIDYFDREIVKRILVALQPTGGSDGSGSFSSAKVEEGSTDAMIAYLRGPLEELWTHGVVKFLVERNRDNLRELGLEDALGWGVPRLRLHGKESRKIEDVDKIFRLARDLNVPVKAEDFYSWTNLSPPNEEDEALVYPTPVLPGAGGLPGAPGEAGEADRILDQDAEKKPVGEGKSSVAEIAQARAIQTFSGSSDQPRDDETDDDESSP
jgi:hypothetical protein